AVGYFDAQPFGRNAHLGADWNGDGGGDTDKGDPVTAAAAGRVIYAEDAGPGWGNVVIVAHGLPDGAVVESLYGHLDRVDVAVGDDLARGDAVGTIGDAHGRYVPHLHFEVRTTPGLGVGGGYAQDATGWTDPTAFVRAHRP
ncbi:MAG: M23 family metallopeptidase, partial [Myxococcota bacterium]